MQKRTGLLPLAVDITAQWFREHLWFMLHHPWYLHS
jgi:hypothetical protein